jgi:hypothetical protein
MQNPHQSSKSSEDGWYVLMRKATSFPQTGSPKNAKIIVCSEERLGLKKGFERLSAQRFFITEKCASQ